MYELPRMLHILTAPSHAYLNFITFFFIFQLDGTGFWVGKKSLLQWRNFAREALSNKIIAEAAAWRAERENTSKKEPEPKQKQQHKRRSTDDGLSLSDLQVLI